MRRTLFLLIALASVLVAGDGYARGTQAATAFALDQQLTKVKNVDRGAAGPSVGDQTLFEAALRDSVSGDPRGSNWGFCVTVAAGSAIEQECRESLVLDTGQLEVQGLLNRTAFDASMPQTLAITGGGGVYATAHGTVTFSRTGAETSSLALSVETPTAPSPASLLFQEAALQSVLLDRGTPGRGAGDETLFSGDLTSGGQPAGRVHGACVTVGEGAVPTAGPFQAQCQETLAVAGGQLVAEGLVDETAAATGAPQTLPLVGGTGAYSDVHGQLTVTATGASSGTVAVSIDPPNSCTIDRRSFIEQGTQFAQVSNETMPRDAGDLLTSVSELVDPNQPGIAGQTYAYFLTVADNNGGTPYIAQASQSIVLPNGTIEMGGAFNQTAFENFTPVIFPINGGTGAYASAHGQVTVQQIMLPATFQLTLDVACGDGTTGVAATSLVARRARSGVIVTWRAASAADVLGFRVWRLGSDGRRTRVSGGFLPARTGRRYRVLDRTAPHHPLRYELEVVGVDGRSRWEAPVIVGS